MKITLAAVILACLPLVVVEAKLRGNIHRQQVPSTKEHHLSPSEDVASYPVLEDKLDLVDNDRGFRWQLLLQQTFATRLNADSAQRRDLLPARWMQLDLWQYMEAVDNEFVASPVYSKFMNLLVAANLEDKLRNATGMTLFAPDNAAITNEQYDFLLAPENEDVLVQTMEYHIVPNIVSYLSLRGSQSETAEEDAGTDFVTRAGDRLDITVSEQGGVRINDNARALAFAFARQCILYRVDRLLTPPSLERKVPRGFFFTVATDILLGGDFEFPIVVPDGLVPSLFLSVPSDAPSAGPIVVLSEEAMSVLPIDVPSSEPSDAPSMTPSDTPSNIPSDIPSSRPSDAPSTLPSDAPSSVPSDTPSTMPSDMPSTSPSDSPSIVPSDMPSNAPSDAPSSVPSDAPSSIPSDAPSGTPSDAPSFIPSDAPSTLSSDAPSTMPSQAPSATSSGVARSSSSTLPSDTPSMVPLGSINIEAASEAPKDNEMSLDDIIADTSVLGYEQGEARELLALFSEASTLFESRRSRGGRNVTYFIPRRFNEVDVEYGMDLQNPAYNLHLMSLVRFHIVSESLTDSDLKSNGVIDMMEGGQIKANAVEDSDEGGGGGSIAIETFADEPAIIVRSAQVKRVGTIHVVDQVLMPQWTTLNVMTVMEAYDDEIKCPSYSKFRTLIVAADVDSTLRSLQDVTVFAPQNDAISQQLAEYLLEPENLFILTNIVTYHIITDAVVSHLEVAAADDGTMRFETFQMSELKLTVAVSLARRAIVYRVGSVLVPDTVRHLMPDSEQVTVNQDAVPETASSNNLEQAVLFPPNREILSQWNERRRREGGFLFG
jgi:uncharacterized surface protein with fasciclin (FAS1) repeats